MSDAEVESTVESRPVPRLAPLSDDAPSGDDLEYDNAFRELLEAGEYKPETEYGGKVYEARDPLWPVVREKALALAPRSHDLRVAVWTARSGARVAGVSAFVDGLRLIEAMLEQYWSSVHPMLDADDNDDPTARLNALAALAAPREGLADLRGCGLTAQRGGLTVRDVELAFKAADPVGAESVPTRAGVVQAIAEEQRRSPGLIATLHAGNAAMTGMVATLERHVARDAMPEFAPLERLFATLDQAAVLADAGTGAVDVAPTDEGGRATGGGLETREDAVRMLELVCVWLDRNDPSNPAPLLIRRAQRLMQKNFLDIIRDLAPDTLDQIEKLAGIEPS